jgi:hypothetical protein
MVPVVGITRSVGLGLVSLVLATILALVLAGCPGPTFIVQQYKGAPRPRESIGILRVNGSESVRLLVLDGEDVAAPIVEDGRLHIEVLPARHTIVVGNASAPNERYAPVAFQAEPGKVYRVTFVAGAGGEPRVYEVDREKDTTVRDVTVAPGVEGAPAPKPAPSPAPAPEARTASDAGAPPATMGGDAG